MRIAIIGGHLTPALSVIEALSREDEVLYIGRKHSMEGDKAPSLEYKIITEKNIRFASVNTGRIQRKFTKYTLPSILKTPVGIAQSLFILKRFKPNVVLGFGGYVSIPVILASKILRIPIVIHEQTLEAGAANIFASKFAEKVCISFESSRKYFPHGKVELTGNPIRKSIQDPKEKHEIKKDKPLIFITGGSQGSHAINLLVMGSLPKLLDKFIVLHQTGDSREFKDFDKLSILKQGLNNNKRENYHLMKFVNPEEFGSILKTADLVVSRSGINTISELIFLKKPSFLIPLPVSQKNEQYKNAIFLKSLGLGEIGDQKTLDSKHFYIMLEKMIENIQSYKLNVSDNKFPKNAAKKIIEIVYASSKNNN